MLSILDNCSNGKKYEFASGNDSSKNSLKKQLGNRIGADYNTPNLVKLISDKLVDGSIDHAKLSGTLTSYKIFHDRTLEVLDKF